MSHVSRFLVEGLCSFPRVNGPNLFVYFKYFCQEWATQVCPTSIRCNNNLFLGFLSHFLLPIKFLSPLRTLTGYFSTTARLKDKPTELQAALSAVDNPASLEILEKLLYNVAVMPSEAKYRRVKLSNPKIKATIADMASAKAVLAVLAWEEETSEEDNEAYLVLPPKKNITMAQVRDVIEAQRELSKKQREMQRSSSTAKLPTTTTA